MPEDEADEAYLEEVLGLRREGDSVPLTRVAAFGISTAWAYAEAKRAPTAPAQEKPR